MRWSGRYRWRKPHRPRGSCRAGYLQGAQSLGWLLETTHPTLRRIAAMAARGAPAINVHARAYRFEAFLVAI
ncbi:hypothetical protein XAXN_17205 [Xanthomonas axonopodis]|uniref:Uncharacterized protein n=1 Tax=Xanthomonas axonopodis TaxID=53413 RepID=A0A0P6W1G2_9XANT|nr:hypothetical protein XAXN_17205 [Xanthomonas axonopodis]